MLSAKRNEYQKQKKGIWIRSFYLTPIPCRRLWFYFLFSKLGQVIITITLLQNEYVDLLFNNYDSAMWESIHTINDISAVVAFMLWLLVYLPIDLQLLSSIRDCRCVNALVSASEISGPLAGLVSSE